MERETLIAPISNFGRPHFVTTDTSHVYFSEGSTLVSMRWDGTDQKTILRTGGGGRGAGGGGGGGGGEMTMSPDGSKVLVQARSVKALPDRGSAEDRQRADDQRDQSGAVRGAGAQADDRRRRVRVAGRGTAGTIYYALGHSLFTYDLAAAEAAVRDSIAQARGPRATRQAPAVADAGRGARRSGAADLRGGAPRRRDHGAERQAAGHGRAARRAHPHDEGHRDHPEGRHRREGQPHRRRRAAGEGATFRPARRSIDVSGKTILPGYVDVHAHIWPAFGVHRSQPFEYLVNLAYGVTTTRDPQTSTTDVLSYSDMVETGEFIGPRIFSTGPGVFAARRTSGRSTTRATCSSSIQSSTIRRRSSST